MSSDRSYPTIKTCIRCKHEPICFIKRTIGQAGNAIYPWWKQNYIDLSEYLAKTCDYYDCSPTTKIEEDKE